MRVLYERPYGDVTVNFVLVALLVALRALGEILCFLYGLHTARKAQENALFRRILHKRKRRQHVRRVATIKASVRQKRSLTSSANLCIIINFLTLANTGSERIIGVITNERLTESFYRKGEIYICGRRTHLIGHARKNSSY